MKPRTAFDYALLEWYRHQPISRENDLRGALSEMARKIGKSRQTLLNMKRGVSMTINSEAVQKVIAELNCDPAIIPISKKKRGRPKKTLDNGQSNADTENVKGEQCESTLTET